MDLSLSYRPNNVSVRRGRDQVDGIFDIRVALKASLVQSDVESRATSVGTEDLCQPEESHAIRICCFVKWRIERGDQFGLFVQVF